MRSLDNTQIKSILSIDEEKLSSYREFSEINANWNILSYLNYNYDINAAIAFSKLFFPDFKIVKDCIVLAFLYNEANFEDWYKEFDGSVPLTEKMSNLYELKDFFHINQEAVDSDMILMFGNALKKIWEINLKQLFPARNFIVDLFDEYNSQFITFYST